MTLGLPPAGHLADECSNWLLAHRAMFGLRNDDTLALAKGGDSFDEGSVEREPRTAYLFDVIHQGYSHSGMQLTATIVDEPALLVGIFNTYARSRRPARPRRHDLRGGLLHGYTLAA
jgi:hypothetical protein